MSNYLFLFFNGRNPKMIISRGGMEAWLLKPVSLKQRYLIQSHRSSPAFL